MFENRSDEDFEHAVQLARTGKRPKIETAAVTTKCYCH